MTEDKIKTSLRYSLLDGIFASIMQGIADTFMAPYALAMKAGARLIGILATMPSLAGSLLQIKSAGLTERLGSRKALINAAVLIHALMWIPIIAIPYLFPTNQAIYLLIFYTLLVSIGAVAAPPWSSLISDHVTESERGRVFGMRNTVFGVMTVASIFAAGLILSSFKEKAVLYGFTAIFSIAFAARLVSWNFLRKMYEPPLTIKPEDKFTIIDFIKRIRKSNFGRFVIFVSAMNFATYMASPYFAVYMLRDLKLDYLTYTIITLSATVTTLCMMRGWGIHADHVGNRRILRLTSLFIPAIPILWIFSHNIFYLIGIQIFAGFFWSGFNLSASNFIYDAVTPAKRARCVAYFNVFNGIAIFSGATLGGGLLRFLPNLFGYKVLTLIALSGILRLAAAMLGSYVKEVRKIKEISNLELFYSMVGLRKDLQLSGGGE